MTNLTTASPPPAAAPTTTAQPNFKNQLLHLVLTKSFTENTSRDDDDDMDDEGDNNIDDTLQSSILKLLMVQRDENDGQQQQQQQQCHRRIQRLGVGGLALEVAKQCQDGRSYERLVKVVTAAILTEWNNSLVLAGKDTKVTSFDGEDIDNNITIEDAIVVDAKGDATTTNLHALCHALCSILSLSGDSSMLIQCANDLFHLTQGGERNGNDSTATATSTSTTVAKDEDNKFAMALREEFVSISQEQRQVSSTASTFGIIYTALSMTSIINESLLKTQDEQLLVNVFLPTLTTPNNIFPTAMQISMAHHFILHSMTQSVLDTSLASILGLKLRAHPEKVLPLLENICSALLETPPTTTTKRQQKIDISSHLIHEADATHPNLLPSVMKHLKSTKANMRSCAWRTLILMAQLTGGGNKVYSSASLITRAICDTLLLTKGAGILSTPDQRAGAYAALEGIARYILVASSIGPNNDMISLSELADTVLVALTTCLPKEKNTVMASGGSSGTDAASLNAKEVGWNALVFWMRISKCASSLEKTTPLSSSGYDKALDYLAEPIVKYNVKDGEFRFRIGSLIASPPSPYLLSIAGIAGNERINTTTMVGETFLESIASELIEKKKLVQEGLVTIIDTAVKKHASSDIVPQVDGVLAILLLVLHRNDKLSSSSIFILPVSASKVVGAGGTDKGASFLFSPSLLEAARTEALVHYSLHRIIALHCKATSKSEGGGSYGDNVGSTTAVKSDQQPLVRLMEKRLKEGHACPYSAATRALAVCVANPYSLSSFSQPLSSVSTIDASVKTIVTYSPTMARAADAIVLALFSHVNELSLKYEATNAISGKESNSIDEITAKLQGGVSLCCSIRTPPLRGYEPLSVQSLSYVLAPHLTQVDALCKTLVLTHVGSSQNQISIMSDMIANVVLPFANRHSEDEEIIDNIARFIALCAAASRFDSKLKSDGENEGKEDDKIPSNDCGFNISNSINEAATKLLATLVSIAGDVEGDNINDEPDADYMLNPSVFASTLCIRKISPLLASRLTDNMNTVEELTETDVALFLSPKGVLFRPGGTGDEFEGDKSVPGPSKSSAAEKKKSRIKGGGGFSALEDEEWERQIKEDLELKRKAQEKATSSSTVKPLSPQEKELLATQTLQRVQISQAVEGDFIRTLTAIRRLCETDIEVGNSLLPCFGQCVIAASVSTCTALTSIDVLRKQCVDTLIALASCVYEIDEVHAPDVARALMISFQSEEKELGHTGKALRVSSLPSPCAPAACAISEMVDYGDCLTANSFCFLFPIVRAALTGPKNIPGCDGALAVLDRHCSMLASENNDAVTKTLRKDIASTILELLLHDRSQTFVNPTPYEVLNACYESYETGANSTDTAFSAAELAPLLADRGALGTENTRVASMETLAFIAQNHPKLVISNPLIENRIWLNCFDTSVRISSAARRAWLAAHGHDDDVDAPKTPLDPPSSFFAVPLLPLLSHDDTSIACAAAASLAFAIGMHPDSAEKNIVKLCSTYISSFPAHGEGDQPTRAVPIPTTQLPPATKPLVKKVKKAPTMSSSLAKITGAPAPKKSAAMKKLLVKSVAPKQERTLDQSALMDQFKSKAEVKTFTAEDDSEAKVAVRIGVLRAISSLTDAKVTIQLPLLKILIGFLMAFGLGDKNEGVRNASRNAARDLIANYGSSDEAIAYFLPQFESVLKTGKVEAHLIDPLNPEKVPQTIAASDQRKEGVIVSLGSIALHLKDNSDESKIDDIIDMLLQTLKTPSEDVQSSVALCLSKLMKKGRTQSRVETILNNLMMECINGSSLASRRGAAYGISAAIKGSGIASLKKYDIVKRLDEACTSGSTVSKEGSLFCIELLSSYLGILFEPYVIVLLPALLKAFSDSNDHVRTAADKTVGLIMGNLSGHGVKLVMPAVLDAFDEPEWRTKQASIHMLGSMSHCAPKQLASCLPKVVPKLTEAFSDTHPKVKNSAEEALQDICKVIKNPEISSISKVLLNAMIDSSGTTRALEALISTEFVHAIDAPSLSIIIPVVHRGLRDRSATTKRYAALISGNICTMVNDPRDFVPYLPILLPDLKSTLIDPIPDVRSISAKSLGSLTRGLGEATFPDLRPWLVDTLCSESGNSVERSGAAQGLSEVLVACGANLTEDVMVTEILPLKSHPKAGTREGVLWVLTFLPSVLGQAYSSLIDESLPALLSGLADDNETVREVALRAGRVLVKSHGKAHKDKILPSLEEGLSNGDYRIRVASLTLLGDLLGMLGGTKVGKANTDTQDDIRQAERAQAQIALALGNETRKRVLSSLYLARSDTAAVVRQSAVNVWKTVVSVTPRTLREILSVLVDQIVSALASGDFERTQVAGRCLGDIVQKLGDQVLPEIIPVLRDNLYRGDEFTRQGVCVGLAEVIDCSSKEQIIKFLEILVKVVQDALCDTDSMVRTMAASCFQNLYALVGNRTLDEIVPALLVAMESDDDVTKTRALNGMTGILGVRSRELLPYIIPRLLKTPLTVSHSDALGSISGVTSETIHMHFSSIIPTLILELASFSVQEDNAREEAVRRCCRSVCHNVDTTGVKWLIGEIASKCTHDKEFVRKEACWMFQVVAEERAKAADFYEPVPIIIRELLHRLNDDSSIVLKANNLALGALTSCVPAEELVNHLRLIRNLIASMVSDARYRKGGVGDGEFFLPGFNMPKGLEPLLPIYQRGILFGDATVRETAAAGLGELITITANTYLTGPFLVKLTGPLLRIVGDRNPSSVKIAIVQTLGLILTKGGLALRAFVPQFQTTFVKALSDPSRSVRIEAIKALALLMPLTSRVDPLIKELVSTSLGRGLNATVDTAGLVAIQTAALDALAVVLQHGGDKVKVTDSIPSSLEAAKELVGHEDDGIRESAAKVIGFACDLLGPDIANTVLQEFVLDKATSLINCTPETKHGMACICRRIFSRSVGMEIDRSTYKSVSLLIQTLMTDEKTMVKESSCVAVGAILGSSTEIKTSLSLLEKSIIACMDTKEELSIQQAVANGLCITARLQPGIFRTEEGLPLINAALKLAMSGAQRVQFSYNDFLWIALDVAKGDESGTTSSALEEYLSLAHFDMAKKMQAIHSKVLVRIKSVNVDEF